MACIQYIVSATLCLSIAYLAFRLLFDHAANFRQQRFFLIISLAVSVLMPMAGFRIDLAGLFDTPHISTQVLRVSDQENISVISSAGHKGFLEYATAAGWIYLSIALALIMAIVIHFIKILSLYRLSQKSLKGKRIILSSTKVENPFSFFHWIFIPSNICDPEERKSIITHESIHVSQYHSIDNLLVELIAAAMWFNPLVWMMKKSFHLVHEYLADEGTLSSGIDRLRYQAFLLNRVTEESLICLPSGFNQSLIKKRMIMMTKSKNYGRNKFRILALVPLSAVLLLIVSLLNGLFPQKAKAESSGLKQPVIIGGSAVTGSVIQDDTIKKKTYKVKVITHDQGNKSKQIRVISDSDGKDTTTYSIIADSIIYVVGEGHDGDTSISHDSRVSVRGKKKVMVTVQDSVKVTKKIEVEVEPVPGEHGVVVEPVPGEHGVVVEPVPGEHGVVVETVKGEHWDVVTDKPVVNKIEIEPGRVTFPDDVIYYIDGKKASKAEVDKINVENIESVSVFKDYGGKQTGGEKGAGVVKITTKKP